MSDIKALLIDADIIVYRAGFSAQKNYSTATHTLTREVVADKDKLGDYPTRNKLLNYILESGGNVADYTIEEQVVVMPEGYARHAAKLIITQILDKFPGCPYKLFLTSTDKSNFRFKRATLKVYKGNRKSSAKPAHYDVVRDYLIGFWNAEVVEGIEADDKLSLLQTKASAKYGEDVTCIVTIDKDLDMVPGYHYNFVKDEVMHTDALGSLQLDTLKSSNRKVLHGSGLKWFYAQMLLGDNADNIPGITGCGAVKVYTLLNPCVTEKELQKAVAGEYKKFYKDKAKEAFAEVGELLWMQQTGRLKPFSKRSE